MVIDNKVTMSKIMDDKIIELTNGKRIIKRKEVDWKKNQKVWEFRGWSLVEDKPKKKKGKK
tara:strand:- start:194 stop:376 length:183 start_codon:yes stop_codon:yes gene_type:complete